MKLNLRVWALLGVAALFVAVAVGASVHNLRRLQDSIAWVRRTNDVLRALADSETALLRTESGERGYVLSGDATYLGDYQRGAADTARSLDRLADAVADNPLQADRVRKLRTVADARLDEFREVINLGPSHRQEALDLLDAIRVRQLTQRVRGTLLELRKSEQALLDERQESVDRVAQEMTGLAAAMTILAVLATAFGAYLLERQQALNRLHAANARAHELQSELLHVSRLSNMGEMASALAHELNQPLAAVTSYLQGSRRLLQDSAEEKATLVREALRKATEQTLRAGDIIRRLREFVAHGETEKRVESLGKIVEETVTLSRLASKEGLVDVAVDIEPEADLAVIDKVQIQQVLLNLVRNAIEAMKDCERRKLSIAARSEADGMIAIEVADTGSGLSPEVAGKLFQPFTTTKAHGLGVGLSISRTIVESHGGQIEALPNDGGGTIFRFTLRAANEVSPAAPSGP